MAERSMITPGLLETNMRMLQMAAIAVVLVTVGSGRVGGGQMLPGQTAVMSKNDVTMRLEQQRLRTAERKKQLVEDTDKLLRLSTALKEQVDESDKNVLSLDMVKKAEEIEKLARSVKERIKG
jgi:hypothetical protein